MLVKNLIARLKRLNQEEEIVFSSDAEGNGLFVNARIAEYDLDGVGKICGRKLAYCVFPDETTKL